jgi:hypothetical protein
VSFILLRFRCGGERVLVIVGRAGIAQMIVAKVLLRRHVGETLDATMPTGALRKIPGCLVWGHTFPFPFLYIGWSRYTKTPLHLM